MCVTMYKILIVSVLVLCYAELCSSVGERKQYNGDDCPRGSPKHILIECNFCKCYDGNLVNCTHYICSKDGFITTGEEQNCIEKEVKYDTCDVCMCRNNTWYCNTRQRCKNVTRSKRSFWESLCIFAGVKKPEDDCVGCRSARTAKKDPCVPADEDVKYISFFEEDLKNVGCSPYDKLALDCSVCTCNPNSYGYNCTTVEDCNEDAPLDLKLRSAKYYINNKLDNNL